MLSMAPTECVRVFPKRIVQQVRNDKVAIQIHCRGTVGERQVSHCGESETSALRPGHQRIRLGAAGPGAYWYDVILCALLVPAVVHFPGRNLRALVDVISEPRLVE